MLKTSKILIFSLAATTIVLGGYILYTKFFANNSVSNNNNLVESTKVFDTIPEKDTSLDALNKILADNNEAKNQTNEKQLVVVETYENIDKNSALYDSLVKAGSVTDVNARVEKTVNESKTIIKADKFISKRLMSIIGFDKRSSDSIVSTLIDVKASNTGKITVEFWESPINFKGYRLGKDKMTVFGIIPNDVNIIKHKSELYFVTINNVYLIKPCSDFCQFKPIKDKNLCTDVMNHVN